jgi:DnaJ-class molecular chaperone
MDHYQTIGVDRNASQEEIKKAYREKSKELHPDANGGDDKGFAALGKAYEILSDPEKRKRYDETGSDNANNDEDMANSLISKLTLTFVENVGNVGEISLTEFISTYLKDQKKRGEEEIKASEAILERTTNASNRIAKKGQGLNIILLTLQTKINFITSDIKNHKNNLLVFERALELIKEYEYTLEEKKESEENRFFSSPFGGNWNHITYRR